MLNEKYPFEVLMLILEHRVALNRADNPNPRPLPAKYLKSLEDEAAIRKAASLLHAPHVRRRAKA